MNISIGTPGQVQTMAIDTGSSNTIVLGSNASFCETSVCAGGTLNLSAASTLETIDSGALQQSYVDHEYFEGDYFGDRVQMSMCKALTFEIASQQPVPCGLGYSSHMAWPGTKSKKVALPPSFVEALVQAGAISSRLYSSILFGGVDTAKYRGPLTTLNVVAEDEKPAGNFYLYLESVTMRPHGGQNRTIVRSTKHRRYRTVPDTGTPSWYLPTSAYRKVIKQAGVTSTDDVPLSSVFEHRKYVRPCRDVAYGTANTTRFDITFSGNGTNTGTLNLELANLFTPLTSEHGSVVTDGDGQPMCWLRVVESDELMITGSAVMRAGYFVFDLDNGQVSLAQANLGANSSNVVQVEAGTGLSKAASDVRSETKKINVEGQMSATAVYKLSTVTSNIDYGTGAKSHPAATGAVSQ
ncbi:acid protease [Aureobasidium namibiae CBS 147.97]|uniref:Acid protease n=1 Tax=Aureobasidium namibiae CBS 147.97 TaxID=1043004 RepID=A0A074WD86_9PEZI|nr:acid protease [Aureobasidium namibiae CBS 147.97]KEQ71065.1 acid protease [Aureobasidium namibiae CBS 147.97]